VTALGRPVDHGFDAICAGLPPPDRGLARAIVNAALRWLTDIDAAIDGAMARPLPPDARARQALRVALAQAWRLGTPPHAVVATALPLVEGGPRRLVHGVLGRLLNKPSPLGGAPTLPSPWATRWAQNYGQLSATAIAGALAAEPPLDLTLRDPDETAVWTERLGGESLTPGHVRLGAHGPVEALLGFAEGAWWVQDLAASLPARLLASAPDEAVLDLAAAPGGKTLQLAAAGALVTAVDASASRLERLRANLARCRLAATVVEADLLAWEPAEPAAAILLDAPCSATGIARRHPDVLYLKATRDTGPLLALQARLLARAVGWLAPGGRLVFATCSLEPEEGERHVERLVEAMPGVALDPVRPDELPAGLTPQPRGWVRTLPCDLPGGIDGFFIARLRRSA
jgi:16S rRNA (cytosine967-C5)-methyltransferase